MFNSRSKAETREFVTRFRNFMFLIGYCSFVVLICALIFGERLTFKDYVLLEFTLIGVSLFFLFRLIKKNLLVVSFLQSDNNSENHRIKDFSKEISNAHSLSDIDRLFLSEVQHLISHPQTAIVEFDSVMNQATVRAGECSDEQLSEWLRYELQTDDFIDLKRNSFFRIYHSQSKSIFLIMDKQEQSFMVTPVKRHQIETMKAFVTIAYEKQFLVEGLLDEIKNVLAKNPNVSSQMVRLVFELSEQEKSKLSLDIHDTALQEQLLWHRRLQELLGSYDIDSQMRASFSEVAEGMLDVIYRIREVCTDLRPQIVWERGICGALNDLFKKIQLRSDFVIKFNASQFSTRLNKEEILTVYRIVQELLNNADKHAKANKVSLVLLSIDDQVVLRYNDDGIGMNVQDVSQEKQGMGIKGIQERVRGLAGSVDFWSYPQQGVWFEISFTPNRRESLSHEIGGLK